MLSPLFDSIRPYGTTERKQRGMERLAGETLSNVLSRLPAKDLMRCKCVCKYWFDLITDSHFISNHYLFYNSLEVQQQQHLLLFRIPWFLAAKIKFSILSWNPNEPKGLVSSQVLNPSSDQRRFWVDIKGPCNGIYFLRGNPNTIMNPSLRQFTNLPSLPRLLDRVDLKYHRFRFGFDPKTNDYKVVVILCQLRTKWRVGLYSLNSNSWKIFEDNPIPFPFAWLCDTSLFFTYVNNCCHWWGYLHKSNKGKSDDVESGKDESDDVEWAILSFDMVSELFRKIKMPKINIPKCPYPSINVTVVSNKNIISFSESATIGILDCYNVGQGIEECFCFDVWMMKDYWDEGSWIKLYSFSPMPVIYRQLLGYYGSYRYLWKEGNTRLVLSGLDSEENRRDLLVCGEFESIAAVRYMESLVSLQRGARF